MAIPTSLDAKQSEDERTTALAFWASPRQPGWDGGERGRGQELLREGKGPQPVTRYREDSPGPLWPELNFSLLPVEAGCSGLVIWALDDFKTI